MLVCIPTTLCPPWHASNAPPTSPQVDFPQRRHLLLTTSDGKFANATDAASCPGRIVTQDAVAAPYVVELEIPCTCEFRDACLWIASKTYQSRLARILFGLQMDGLQHAWDELATVAQAAKSHPSNASRPQRPTRPTPRRSCA